MERAKGRMLMPAWVSAAYLCELASGKMDRHACVAGALLVFVAVDERLVQVEDDGFHVW